MDLRVSSLTDLRVSSLMDLRVSTLMDLRVSSLTDLRVSSLMDLGIPLVWPLWGYLGGGAWCQYVWLLEGGGMAKRLGLGCGAGCGAQAWGHTLK